MLTLFTTQALAQKTAFVNEVQLLAATPGYEKALQEMDSLKTIYTQELQASQTQFEANVETLRARDDFGKQRTAIAIDAKHTETDLQKWTLLNEDKRSIGKHSSTN